MHFLHYICNPLEEVKAVQNGDVETNDINDPYLDNIITRFLYCNLNFFFTFRFRLSLYKMGKYYLFRAQHLIPGPTQLPHSIAKSEIC